MINTHQIDLPRGWILTTLGEITNIKMGQSPPSSSYNKTHKGVPFYQGKKDFTNLHPKTSTWCIDPKVLVDKGDILISVRAPVGPTNLCLEKSCIGRGLAGIKPLDEIPEFFILYFLRYIEKQISKTGSGSTFNAITRKELEAISIPIAPLNEQKRLVSKVMGLFTKLSYSQEYIKKTEILLKKYRQSLLTYAFEGKLTEKWREKQKEQIESSKLLLTKIIKSSKNQTIDNSELYFETNGDNNIPLSWMWTKIDFISEVNPRFGDNLPDDIEVSFLPMRCVDEESGNIDLTLTKLIRDVKKGYTPFINNDIVFAKITPCMENGKIAIVNNLKNSIGFGSTEFHVIRLNNLLPRKYYFYYLLQEKVRNDAKRNMRGTAGQLRVPPQYVKEIKIPFPPIEEQYAIIEQIEKNLSVINGIENNIKNYFFKKDFLIHNILKYAFEGKLVTQNPNDEPASDLLEKIKQKKSILGKNNLKQTRNKSDYKQMKLI